MRNMLGQPWKGYYLTAYGIAVKHGFKGTEEEWLASLKGEPGAKVQLRFSEESNCLEWKSEDGGNWEVLMYLSDLQTDVSNSVVARAMMAAEDAMDAKAEAAAMANTARTEAEKAAAAEKNILQNILQYGSVVNNAYVLGDTLYIATSDGKVFTAGNVRGSKGDTGDSGVHIGAEAPTDPEKNVWIDPTGHDGMREIVNILSRLKYTAGGVQVDLSDYAKGVDLAERNETAAGFVRNKTHYEYMDCGVTATGTIESIDENNLLDGTCEISSYVTPLAITLTTGKKYKVELGAETHIITWAGNWTKVGKQANIDIRNEYEENIEIVIYTICPEEEKPAWCANGVQISITPIDNHEIKQLPERFIPDYISGKEVKELHKDMYVIAPSNTPDKSRADLVLSGDVDSDYYELSLFLYNLEKPGKVVFLPGTVTLPDVLEISSGMTVEGYGTTFVADNQYNLFYICDDAEIKGVKITTTTRVDTEENQSGLKLVQVAGAGAKITDCRMYTTWGTCIYVPEGVLSSWQSNSVKIHGNTLKGNTAIVVDDKSIVEGNTIIGTKTAHPVTVGGSGCIISGNDIRSYTETYDSEEIKGISVSGNDNVIVGNVVPVIKNGGTGNVSSGNAGVVDKGELM